MLKDLDNDISVNDGIVFVHAESDNVLFLVMIWILLMYTLILLALMMLILTMMILKLLLFILDSWIGVIEISNERNVKKR